jgi:4-aminobutyrate aminotransferase-like enzyme
VADEVQTGFGRFGSSYWGFQQQDVIPDIVTLGKPFGNGLPLAAVVTTRAISDSFNNGLEYFNTFGGNPVCCAAGMAVMQVVEDEGLQDNAREVGDYLKQGFLRLQKRFEIIGDVRGSGLFLGVEFVLDRTSLTPATAQTVTILARLKAEFGILTSSFGAHDNVMVIKPPMCFSQANADTFLASLSAVLADLRAQK